MIPIALEESSGSAGTEPGPCGDPLARVVRVALAIYLLPVVAVVCAIGGASILIVGSVRLAIRWAGADRRGVVPARPATRGPLAAGPITSARRRRERARTHR